MAMIPQAVVAAGWIPFVVVLFLTLCFAFFYIRYFQSKYDSEVQSTIASILGLTVAFLTLALVPIDIFLVSYMKDNDGHFKDWAQNQTERDSVTSSVLYAYYALYICEMVFLFLVLPFSYFFYEEGDENTTTKSRLCSAFKFTCVFILMAAVLLVVGIFAPLKTTPSTNATEWEYIKNIFSDLKSTRMEDAVSFSMSSLTTVGVLILIIYMGYGLSAWPMDLLKGRRSTASETADLQEERSHLEAQVNSIKAKTRGKTEVLKDRNKPLGPTQIKQDIGVEDAVSDKILLVTLWNDAALHEISEGLQVSILDSKVVHNEYEKVRAVYVDYSDNIIYTSGRRSMSRRDRRRLEELEERVELMNRREHHLQATERSWLHRCSVVLRPFQIIFGVIFLLVTLLIFLSLLLTSIDKLLHSLGHRMGYALPVRRLPNPIDITLVFAQQVFPLDYILLGAIVMFLFFCSMGGIQHIGIWFCCIRMYKMRPGRTKPQGLLMLVFCLMLIVLAMNVLIYQITPQYSTYGGQHYVATSVEKNVTKHTLIPCSSEASQDECVMTRMSMLLTRFFYKVWIFGAIYYWANWALLLVMLIGFVVAVVRKRRSAVEGSVDRDDFDSDDEIITA